MQKIDRNHRSGAPRGKKNALKHGFFTREAIAERRQLRELIRQSRKLLLKRVTRMQRRAPTAEREGQGRSPRLIGSS
jgi:hypothetical protein